MDHVHMHEDAAPDAPLPEYCLPDADPYAYGQVFRLRKATDGSILGPITMIEMMTNAHNALIAPFDEIDASDENWVLAPEVSNLEMHYQICSTDGVGYGPTTIGTITEFYNLGECLIEDFVLNVRTGDEKTIAEILELRLKNRRKKRRKKSRKAVKKVEVDDEDDDDED